MTRKRTVRRVYDLINPLTHAAYQASRLTTAEWNTQMIPVQAAADCLSRGEWTPDNWQPIFECLNRIESLTKLNHVKAQEFITEAQTAMMQALARKDETGATAFRSNELAKIREVVQVYGDLLGEASHAQFARACAHTNANMDRILKQKQGLKRIGNCVFE